MYKEIFDEFLAVAKKGAMDIEFKSVDCTHWKEFRLYVNGLSSIPWIEREDKTQEDMYKYFIHSAMYKGIVFYAIGNAGMFAGSEGDKYLKESRYNQKDYNP